jgi:hypothetical protein
VLAGVLGDFPRALLAVAEVGTFGARKYSRGGDEGGWLASDEEVRPIMPAPTPRQLEYQRYRQSPIWQQIRALVTHRSGGICCECGGRVAPNQVEIHHFRYPAVLGTEPLEWLGLMHATCHGKWHRENKPTWETMPEMVLRICALNMRKTDSVTAGKPANQMARRA